MNRRVKELLFIGAVATVGIIAVGLTVKNMAWFETTPSISAEDRAAVNQIIERGLGIIPNNSIDLQAPAERVADEVPMDWRP